MELEYVLGVVIDPCTRTFLLLGNQGKRQFIECKTPQQFIDVWNLVNDKLKPTQIEYAEPAIVGE